MSDSSPHLDEHVSTQPNLSPGVVEDDELLLRELFNPQHVRNGELLPSAIQTEDLLLRGFSVNRMRYVTAEFVKAAIEKRLSEKGEPWKDEGAAKLKALEVRQIRFDDCQAFVVIDTAERNNPGHASIYAAAPEKGKPHARELRELLLPFLQERMHVDKAFEETESPR